MTAATPTPGEREEDIKDAEEWLDSIKGVLAANPLSEHSLRYSAMVLTDILAHLRSSRLEAALLREREDGALRALTIEVERRMECEHALALFVKYDGEDTDDVRMMLNYADAIKAARQALAAPPTTEGNNGGR